MVPGEAQFEKEVGLPSWFSTVVCQGWCGRGLLETSKLEIFEKTRYREGHKIVDTTSGEWEWKKLSPTLEAFWCHKECMENRRENMHTDVWVQGVNQKSIFSFIFQVVFMVKQRWITTLSESRSWRLREPRKVTYTCTCFLNRKFSKGNRNLAVFH